MAKLNIYVIKDVKVGSFTSAPMVLVNDDVAVRTFKAAVNAKNGSQICEYYEDMQIWKLGEFDDKTGEIISNVEFIANGSDVKEFKKETQEECNSEAN